MANIRKIEGKKKLYHDSLESFRLLCEKKTVARSEVFLSIWVRFVSPICRSIWYVAHAKMENGGSILGC